MMHSYRFDTNPIAPQVDWPESWKLSNYYDQIELWGSKADLGYATMSELRRP